MHNSNLYAYDALLADSPAMTGEGINTDGPTLGGTGVALTGIFPAKGTAIEVDFDNVVGEVATVDSTNRITVNTPAHAAGTVDVTLYEKNSDGTKTFLGSLPHAYQYRPQRCTLGNGTFGAIDQCVTELKACVYVPTAPTSTKHIEVMSHLVTNPTLTGGMPQCVDAMPKFDLITVKTTDTYPKILCTTANAPLIANRSSTPSAACASLASNAAGKVPNLTMIDLSYRDATGASDKEEHALVVPLTWEDRVSLIAAGSETYKGTGSMQLAKNGYSPQTSSTGFCLLTNLPDAAHLPAPIANQNYCLNASLYTPPNESLGSSPWTLQTIADKNSFMVVDAGSQLV